MTNTRHNSRTWLWMLPLVGALAGCCCQAFPLPGEEHCPTDARRIYCTPGEEAVRRCPCGPDEDFYGHKPTGWRPWPEGWRCGQYPCVPAGAEMPVQFENVNAAPNESAPDTNSSPNSQELPAATPPQELPPLDWQQPRTSKRPGVRRQPIMLPVNAPARQAEPVDDHVAVVEPNQFEAPADATVTRIKRPRRQRFDDDLEPATIVSDEQEKAVLIAAQNFAPIPSQLQFNAPAEPCVTPKMPPKMLSVVVPAGWEEHKTKAKPKATMRNGEPVSQRLVQHISHNLSN
jgi:hypothetical protein